MMNTSKAILLHQMARVIGTAILLFCTFTGFSQNFTNKGKDFWVGYGHHQFMEDEGTCGGTNITNRMNLVLYISAEQAATVTITIDSSGLFPATWYRQTLNIPANTVMRSINIPKGTINSTNTKPSESTNPNYDARLITDAPPAGTGGEGIFRKKGIHIESDVPVVVYAHVWGATNSGATMLMPTHTWGYSYTSVNSQQGNNVTNSFSWMFVIAKEDNTKVEIVPSGPTRAGKPAGVPFQVLLMKGQIYQLVGQAACATGTGPQLTGTTVKSIAGPDNKCHPIAVFSGSSRTEGEVSLCGSSSRDNDIQQLFPEQSWGTRYLTAPFSKASSPTAINASSFFNCVYKVVVKDPSTVVRVNGLPITGPPFNATLVNNKYYAYRSGTADYIEASKPVMVAQFISSGSLCGSGTLGDPEMVIISPIEQASKKVAFYRGKQESIAVNYLTLIIPTGGLPSLRIDNSNVFNHVYAHPNKPGHSVVVKGWPAVDGGAQCIVSSDSSFTAITYGLGSAESYAYNAGTNIINLNGLSYIKNLYDTAQKTSSAYTCKNTPIKLSALIAYQPNKIEWKLSALGTAISPNADIVQVNPVVDSVLTINDQIYYRYSLPGTFTFNNTGTFFLPILATAPTIDICTRTEELALEIIVKPEPIVDYTFTASPCGLDTVQFNSLNTTSNNYSVREWQWSYPDADTARIQNPRKLFPGAGTYPVKLQMITQEGCVSDITKNITLVNVNGNADIVASQDTICAGTSITFTDPSVTTGVTSWYWDFGNGTAPITVTSNTPQTASYPLPGKYIVKHLAHTGSSGGACSDTIRKEIVVYANPVVGFTYPQGCLPVDGIVQFTDTSKISDAQVLSWSWNFGDPASGSNNTSTLQHPTHTYASSGNYSVTLTVTTANGCTKSVTLPVSFTPQPAVAVSPTAISVCAGSTATLTASGATTFTWSPATGLNTTSGASVIATPTATSTYTVTGSNGTCSGSATVTVTVNPVPAKPAVTTPVTYCQDATASPLVATAATGNTLTWYTDPLLTGGSSATPVPPTNAPGTSFYYVTQTSPENCTSDTSRITVNIIASISGNTIGNDQTLCSGTAPATLTAATAPGGGTGSFTYQWQQSTDGGSTWTDISGATSASFAPGTISGTIQYRRKVSSASCNSISNAVTITVQGSLTGASISADQTICKEATPALIDGQTPSGGSGSFVFQWESSSDNINWTTITGATTEDYQPGALTNNTYFRRKITSGICNGTSNSVLITVNPKPVGSFTGPTAICSYDPASISFTASAGAPPFNLVFTITAPGGSASTIAQTITSNGPVTIPVLNAGAAAGNHSIALTSFTDNFGCAATPLPAPHIITVTAKPSITVSPSPTICAGSGTMLTASGATDFNWSPSTGLNTTTGASVTATPSSTTTYVVIGTTNGCNGTSTVTVSVINAPAKPVVTTPVVYCLNDAAVALSATASNGNTLSWYNNAALTGGSSTAPVPSTATAGTTIYYVTQTNSTNCQSPSETITVTVHPSIGNNVISGAQTICQGSVASGVMEAGSVTGGSGSYTYQWQNSPDGGTTWTNISGATSANYNPPILNNTTSYRRLVNSTPCTSISNTVTITILVPLANKDISAAQTICSGSTPALLDGQTPTGGNGTYGYQWQSATNAAGPWTDIAGANAEDLQASALTASTYFRRTISSGPCNAISNAVLVTVNPNPVASISGPSAICQADQGDISFTASAGAAPYTVVLYISVPGGTGNSVTKTGLGNTGSINVIPANSMAGNYTITITSLTDNNGCVAAPGQPPVTITVTAKPVLSFGTATPICNGGSTTLTVSGATTYSWSPAGSLSASTGSSVTASPVTTTKYYVTGTTNGCTGTDSIELVVNPVPAKPTVVTPVNYCLNATAGPLSATAAAGNMLTWYTQPTGTGSSTAPVPSTATAGSFPYYVTQTNSFGCESQAEIITVVITEAITGNTISADQTLCPGTVPATLNPVGTPTGGTGSYTYKWQSSTDAGLTWTDIAGATGTNYTPAAITVTTRFRRVATSGLCGANSNEVTVTIQGAINDTGISGDQTVCNGATPSLLAGNAASGGNGSFAYQWESSTDNSNWITISGAISKDLQPGGLIVNTWFRRKVSSGPCSTVSNIVLVTVVRNPSGFLAGPSAICVYDSASISFTATGGTAPFTINFNIDGPSGITSGSRPVADNGPVNFTLIPANSAAGNYTISLTSITDSKGCTQTAGLNTILTTVNPKPALNVSAGSAMCAGSSVTLTASGATSYAWGPAAGLRDTVGASVIASPATTTTYTVTGTSKSCVDSRQITVTVNPVPPVPVVASVIDYCQEELASALTASGNAGNAITWYTNPSLTGGNSVAPVPSTMIADTISYFVTQTSPEGCVSNAARILVAVHPNPVANFTMPAAICRPESAVFTASSTIDRNQAVVHTWSFGDGSPTASGSPIAHSYATVQSYPVFLTTTSVYGCVDTITKTLDASVFHDKPVAMFQVNRDTLCQGLDHVFTDSSIVAGGIRSWTWNFGDGSAPVSSKNVTRAYKNPGRYQVQLTIRDSAGCVSDPAMDTVYVQLQPKVDAGPSFHVLQGTTVRFNPKVNDSTNISFTWTPPAGLSDPNYLRPTLNVQANQTYTLTAVGLGDCAASDTMSVYVLKPVNIPNAFSPNGDGVNDRWEIPNLAAYPGATVEVYNRYGQLVFASSGYGTPWNGTYKGSPLPVATYYYIIVLKNGFQPLTGSITIIK